MSSTLCKKPRSGIRKKTIRTTLAVGTGISLASAGGGLAGASTANSHATPLSAKTTSTSGANTVATATIQQTDDPLAKFQLQLLQDFPSSYGGFYQNPDGTYSVVVVGTDPALEASAQALFNQIPSQFGVTVPAATLKLTFASGSRTLTALYSIQDQAVAKMQSPIASGEASGIKSVGINEQTNQVVVVNDGSAAGVSATTTLSALYGSAIFVKTTTKQSTVLKTARESDGSPWKSGDQIVGYAYTKKVGCTLGFGVHDKTTGQEYSITAGHCGNSTWFNTTYKVSTKNTSTKIGATSILAFPGPGTTGIDTQLVADSSTTHMWRGPLGGAYLIEISGYANPVTGATVCNEGSFGGESCGKVYTVTTTRCGDLNGEEACVNHLFLVVASSTGGDSGGPMMYPTIFGPLAGGQIEGLGTTYGEEIDAILFVDTVALGGSIVVSSATTP
jgi:hypothetical protein